LVGTVHEEAGGYFPHFMKKLEANPFLHLVMPWGSLSILDGKSPEESNDGPIMWIRPGEQLIPTERDRNASKRKRFVLQTVFYHLNNTFIVTA